MLAAGGSVGGTRRRLGPDLRRRRGGHSSTAAAPPSPVPRAVAPGGDFLEDFDAIASLRRGKAPNGGGGVVGGVAATAAAAAASSSSSASSASPSPTARGKPAFAAAPASAEATPFRTAEEVLLFSLNGGAGEGEEEGPFDDGIFVDDDEEALVVAAAMSSSSFRVEGEEEEPAFAAAASAAASAAAAAAAARSSPPAPSSASEVAVAVTFAEDDEDDSDGEDDEELLPTPSSQRALGGAAAAAAALRSELKDCSSPEDVLDVAADEVGGGLSPACATALLERLAALERRGSSSSSSASACCERSPAFLALLDEVEAAAAAGAMRPRDLAQSAWALGALRALRGRSAAAARALASAASARKLCPLLTGQDLAALFHGLGRLRADPGRDALSALGQAAASAARGEDARSLGAQSLSMVCWGLAELCSPSPSPSSKRSAAPPPGVVEALGAALAALASESSSDGSSSSPSSPSAVEASSSASSSSSPSSPSPALGPQALAVAASALARLGWQPSRAEAAAVGRAIAAAASPSAVAADDARAEAEREAATGRGPSSFGRPAALPASKRTSFRPRELTSALFALAEWRSPSPEALSSVAQRLRSGGAGPGGERTGPVDWATAAWAFASLGGDMTEEGWRRAERELEEAAPALSVRELANAVWGLALAERFGGGEQLSGGEGRGRGRGGAGDGAPSPPSSSPPPSSFDVLLAAALEAAEARWPIDARAVAQIARAHASAAVLRGRGGNATLPALPQRLSDAAERRARTAAARSPLSLTHARVAALARDCGLPVSGVRVPLGVGLPVVDVALELRDDAEPGEATRVAVQVHCPREAPRAPAAGGGDASPALLGRAASAARLLRALGWLPIVVRPQDVPSSAPRAAQAAALMDCVRKGVAAALATDAPSSSGSDSFSSSTSSLPPREAEARAAALLAGSTGSMKLTAADFVSPPPSSSSDRRRTGGGRGGRGSGDGGGGGGGRGRGASGGGSGRGGGGRSSSFSSQRKPPSGSNKFSPGGGWGEVS